MENIKRKQYQSLNKSNKAICIDRNAPDKFVVSRCVQIHVQTSEWAIADLRSLSHF